MTISADIFFWVSFVFLLGLLSILEAVVLNAAQEIEKGWDYKCRYLIQEIKPKHTGQT